MIGSDPGQLIGERDDPIQIVRPDISLCGSWHTAQVMATL